MDISTRLAEITAWSVDDRIRLVQAILDTIAADSTQPELTEELKRELDRRIADMDANPDDEFTWDEVKAFARAKP